MAGQSNMLGAGKKDAHLFKAIPENIEYYNYALSSKLKPSKNRFGPEYGLSEKLSQAYPKQQFVLMKYAVGGSSLAGDWNPDYSKEKAEVLGNPDFGNLYDTFFQKTDSLLLTKDMQPTALLWMQGEADSKKLEAGKNYYNNLKEFIQRVHQQINNKELPIIIAVVNPPAKRFPALQNVRTAQRKIAKDIPNVYIVETDDLPKREDNVHYNGQGQLELGKRFGVEVLKILQKY